MTPLRKPSEASLAVEDREARNFTALSAMAVRVMSMTLDDYRREVGERYHIHPRSGLAHEVALQARSGDLSLLKARLRTHKRWVKFHVSREGEA